MLNEEEKFDDLLRSKLNGREFFFDELNWQKAEKAIQRDDDKRKRRRTAIIFIGGFILGAAIMFPLAGLLNKKPQNTLSNTTISAPDNNKPVTVTIDTSVKKQQAVASTEKTTQSSNKETTTSTPVPVVDTKNNNRSNTASTNTITNYEYVRPASERKKKHQQKMLASGNNQPGVPFTGNQNIRGNNNSIQPQNTTSDNSNGTNSVSSNKNSADTQHLAISTQQNTPVNKTSTATSTDSAQQKQQPNVAASNSPPLMPSSPPATKNKSSAFILSAELGAGYSFGWKSETGHSGNGISPLVGINASYFFNTKLGLYLGLRYNSLGNLNTPYSGITSSYDFGLHSSTTTVSPQLLHYVAVPAGISYKPDDKNIVCLGANVLYLINTSSEVTTNVQDGSKAPTNQKKTAWGYMDGFNPMDVQLVVAYKRRLLKSLCISAEGYYGLMDVENNSFFMNNSFQRNMGVRLVLSYDFIN